MNFLNIFYTLHVDGSRYINLHGCNNGYIYKINNENIIFNNINNHTCINNIHICEKEIKRQNTNNIVIWIRSSNKWSTKNIHEDIYNTLFDYCISNNKKCFVFQDLMPINLPNHYNIIDSTTRYKNRPDFDYFIKICSESDIFIGADSGPLYLLLHQPINILKLCTDTTSYSNSSLISSINKNILIDKLNDFYNSK